MKNKMIGNYSNEGVLNISATNLQEFESLIKKAKKKKKKKKKKNKLTNCRTQSISLNSSILVLSSQQIRIISYLLYRK